MAALAKLQCKPQQPPYNHKREEAISVTSLTMTIAVRPYILAARTHLTIYCYCTVEVQTECDSDSIGKSETNGAALNQQLSYEEIS